MGLLKQPIIKFYRAVGEYDFLSNLFKREIEFEGYIFPTSEHAYQFGKFHNIKARNWAMKGPYPHLVAIVSHGLFGFDMVEKWNEIKIDRMRRVLTAKFLQHSDLAEKLINTKDAILIEESSFDNFWGCGPKGKGKNKLGYLLMEIRSKLQQNKLKPYPVILKEKRLTDLFCKSCPHLQLVGYIPHIQDLDLSCGENVDLDVDDDFDSSKWGCELHSKWIKQKVTELA